MQYMVMSCMVMHAVAMVLVKGKEHAAVVLQSPCFVKLFLFLFQNS